jgi:hypothetical protein
MNRYRKANAGANPNAKAHDPANIARNKCQLQLEIFRVQVPIKILFSPL